MRRLLVGLIVFTFFTIVLGSWVRNAGAGLSCPDWPLCHGLIIPPMEYRIMLEYFHRLAAAGVGILLLVGLVWSWWAPKYRKGAALWLSGALFVLFIQIILGKLTVTRLLQWEVVAMHLGVAIILLSLIVMAYRSVATQEIAPGPQKGATRALRVWGRLALLVLYSQILLGGSVSSNYAGLACPDFPTCHGLWFPGFSGLAGLHFLHRLGALVASFVLIALLWQWHKQREFYRDPWKMVPMALAALLALQWLLGVGMIIWGVPNSMTIPAPASVAHLAVGALIFVLVLSAVYEFERRELS